MVDNGADLEQRVFEQLRANPRAWLRLYAIRVGIRRQQARPGRLDSPKLTVREMRELLTALDRPAPAMGALKQFYLLALQDALVDMKWLAGRLC